MTNSDAIREFAEVITQQILTYLRAEACFIGEFENEIRKKIEEQFTALISEHYVAKEEVDKMVSEKLREKLFSMRSSKEAMDKLSEDDRLMMYGYHDCINEMLMWTKSRER